MAKPKLCLIPASQGSKVFSVLPSSGVGDFDFSRGGKATRINSQGLIEEVSNGQSRLDYPLIDGVVNGCPSLLLEPSRTQLIQYSEDFSNAAWAGAAVTRELNQIISPDGSLNGVKISASAAFAQIQQTYTSINDADYTLSLFAKLPSSNVVALRLASGSNDVRREFNLSTLSIQSMGGNNQELIDEGIENYGNGWYRIFLTCKADGTSAFLNIYPKNSSVATLQSVFIFGAQIEQGSYPTSYIPNYGTIAGVTRSAETANGSGDATTFNDSEGVLMAEIANISENQTTTVAFSLSDGSLINSISVYYFGTSGLYYDIFNSAGTRSGSTPMTKIQQTSNNKISLKYKSGDIALWVNGFEVNTNVGTLSLSGLSELNLDYGNGGFPFYGKTKQIQYYNSALTDSELEQLTSWISFTDMANGQLYTIE